MAKFMQPEETKSLLDNIPTRLPILPLRNTVGFPFSVLPLLVGIPRSLKLVEDALQGNKIIGMVAVKDSSIDEPMPGQVYETGTVAIIHRSVTSPDGNMQVLVQGLERFRIKNWNTALPYLQADIELIPDQVKEDVELDALARSLRALAQEVITLSPNLPDEAANYLSHVDDPRYLAYLVAANAGMEVGEGQLVLEQDDIKEKLRLLINHLTKEKELLRLGQKIQSDAREEMDKAQREYYLRQQLKAIQKELGEHDESGSTADEYRQKLKDAFLPKEAFDEAMRELKRIENMPPQAAEHSVIRTYLDWMVELPWNKLSDDQLDINHARQVLDEDHYDLQEVKDRILEYLAVRKLVKERSHSEEKKDISQAEQEANKRKQQSTVSTVREAMGVILCFVGPPGVGKTSLGQSIARALGRQFTRMSLGGMRDEAEIRGHRRTYIGAMPGRIIQAIKRAGTRNPVFMLDEIDKVGMDWRGDPSSALLEVLDPAQNHSFRDHYLDVDFNLSDVIFITTANQLETIPPPLRDRMEIIRIDGYTEYEKIKIAQRYLVPRQIDTNGLRPEEVIFKEEALKKIIQDYTRESGVRNLERQIGTICRKTAVKIAAGDVKTMEINPEHVREFLKREKFESEVSENIDIPGIATGLAVTAVGGDILFIEATSMKGKGKLTLTGQLGDVMQESARIAHSFIRSKAIQLGVDPDLFENNDIHIHIPAGAIPKDGPSAGITIVAAMASLFTGHPVHSDLGMTGEITLRGRVMPIGGVKMKVLAAHRAGLKKVMLPKRNEKDLEDLPQEIIDSLEFIKVERIDDVLKHALLSQINDKKNTEETDTLKNHLPQHSQVSNN